MAKEGGHAVTLPAGGQVDNALWSYVASGTFVHDLDPTAGLCQPTSRPRRYSADAATW